MPTFPGTSIYPSTTMFPSAGEPEEALMATIIKSFVTGGSVTQATGSGAPQAQVVALTDGEGNILGDTGDVTLITADGVTDTQVSADQVNTDSRGVIVVLDMTDVGTGSVTLTIQGSDIASGKYYALLAGAAVTTDSTNVYTVYPGMGAVSNVSANAPLPRTWRVRVASNNSNEVAYTVGASTLR